MLITMSTHKLAGYKMRAQSIGVTKCSRQQCNTVSGNAAQRYEFRSPLITPSLARHSARVIYDFGANNGDDVPYYLKKADIVIAVEANPLLVAQIRERFSKELNAGRLIVENCALTTEPRSSGVTFYLHKSNHVRSQFPRPADSVLDDYEEIVVPSENVVDLIKTYGEPFYIKIDVEHYDQNILEHLFLHDIRPPFISAESHSIEVFSLFVALGKYKSFNLVDGETVATKYRNHIIKTDDREEIYSFPHHSAGPFGTDIHGPWMTANNFFRLLAFEQLGWKDVHATTMIEADPACAPQLGEYFRKAIKSTIAFALRKSIQAPMHLFEEKSARIVRWLRSWHK